MVLAYPIALGVGFRFPALPPNEFELAAILSVPLGVVVPKILNRFFSQENAERKIAEAYGDLVELLIAEAIDRAKLIEVSLSNGKSYIGLPFRSKITKWPESHVAVLPLWMRLSRQGHQRASDYNELRAGNSRPSGGQIRVRG